MNETVTIILPLPNRVLHPNHPVISHGGRMKKAAAAKRYRRLARQATEENNVATAPWQLASIKAHFYHKTSRRRDDVNSMQSLKSAYDGIVDAGLLVDDDSEHLKTLTPEFHKDTVFPRVELIITRMD